MLKQIVRQPNPHEIQFMKGAKFSMAPRSVSQQQTEYNNQTGEQSKEPSEKEDDEDNDDKE